jgi:hypothetical protein
MKCNDGDIIESRLPVAQQQRYPPTVAGLQRDLDAAGEMVCYRFFMESGLATRRSTPTANC